MINKERFTRMIQPKTIVVFGSRGAGYAIRECQRIGFEGEIWAVHPKRDELDGLKCYRSIAELPGIPDAAYVAVNAEAAIEIVRELTEIGCGGAALYASGFSEVGGDGVERQERLVEAAGDMPIIGPNCYGIINAMDRVALWPDQHGCKPVDKGVAIITQSGNIAINMTMQRRGVPVAYMFTLGNQAAVSIAEVMDAVLEDDRVTAIGLHIEAIKDVNEFDRVARIAHEKKVPIIAMKTGRSSAAAKIAMSHTSSLAGADSLFNALFDRLGIARVNTVNDLLETLKLISILGPLKGNKVASMSCSGGEAGVMADLIEDTDLVFPDLTKEHADRVEETLGDYVSMSNPLDYHTYIWGDEDAKTATFSAMMSGGFDATMLLLDWPNYEGADHTDWDAGRNALINASRATGGKGIVLASMAECMPSHAIEIARNGGIAPMIGLDTCLKALNASYKVGLALERDLPEPLAMSKPISGDVEMLDEWKSKKLLNSYGLQTPESALVSNATEAVAAAEALGFPVVVKAVGSHLAHKTEMGAVKLNMKNGDDVNDAVEAMSDLSDRFLVEKMVPDFIAELIIGVTRDDQFGPTLVIGAGGILVELLKDSATLLLPTSEEEIRQAINGLKTSMLLKGFRGKSEADIDAIVKAVMAVAKFVDDYPHQVEELDVNPLMVCPKGQGAFAADALIRMSSK
ncbi:acetate--CoA ligase family protein [Curvivirga aplysinae]|uniref:acetate--CoA ligase family protein n=1 Tax=Curvivirga aplysinae TaxID=2529852 RepID=UPI001C3F9BD0|nr:acetate--CoA ligase family protein [Curvivirga aplysinae]